MVGVELTTKGCREWIGGLFDNGYGRFSMRGRDERANRVAFKIAHGCLSPDLFICHKCDNRRCVNPDHLYQGTQKQNMMDASSRGRMPTGENHHFIRNPSLKKIGDQHWTRFKPECLARGIKNGSSTHPEMIRKGEDCGRSKLKESDVIQIRAFGRSGVSRTQIARAFNTTPGNVDFIIQRKTWKHL